MPLREFYESLSQLERAFKHDALPEVILYCSKSGEVDGFSASPLQSNSLWKDREGNGCADWVTKWAREIDYDVLLLENFLAALGLLALADARGE